MARYIRLGGLASIVVVEDDREIDTLLDDPRIERDYTPAGPLLNRLMTARLRRGIDLNGRALMSFRPRTDVERKIAQRRLGQRLDALAVRRPWAPEALAAMAAYVTTGKDRDGALSALTYVTAFPFLSSGVDGRPPAFEPDQFRRLYRLYRMLARARRPWAGALLRLANLDRRARDKILQAVNGDEYGLHALGITLDNSVVILDQMCALLTGPGANDDGSGSATWWELVRTAPVLLFRQTTAPCRLPGIDTSLAANALILLRTRRALRPETRPGFEFAADHWSGCPGGRYIEAVFQAVWDLAVPAPTEALRASV